MSKEDFYNKMVRLSSFEKEFNNLVLNKGKSSSETSSVKPTTIRKNWITTFKELNKEGDCLIFFGIKVGMRDDKSKSISLRLLGTGTLPTEVTPSDLYKLIIKNMANVTFNKDDFYTSIQCSILK